MSKLPNVPMAELRPMVCKPRKAKPAPMPIVKYTVYMCPELGRTCTRPNAYDAFDLPSIYAGERKPYRFAKSLP